MRINVRTLSLLAAGMCLLACSVPKGTSLEARREYVHRMKNETLARLYRENPAAKKKIENSAGYAVFSSVNANLLLFSTASGYGVCENKRTGTTTYMRMHQFGVGPGLGLKDYRAVLVFYDPRVLNDFVENGWEFGGQADAAAKSAEKGAAVGGQASFNEAIEIYTLTEAGVALQATLAGTRYWKDNELN